VFLYLRIRRLAPALCRTRPGSQTDRNEWGYANRDNPRLSSETPLSPNCLSIVFIGSCPTNPPARRADGPATELENPRMPDFQARFHCTRRLCGAGGKSSALPMWETIEVSERRTSRFGPKTVAAACPVKQLIVRKKNDSFWPGCFDMLRTGAGALSARLLGLSKLRTRRLSGGLVCISERHFGHGSGIWKGLLQPGISDGATTAAGLGKPRVKNPEPPRRSCLPMGGPVFPPETQKRN